MQVTQSGDNSRRVGVNEDRIKFTPSPNFKNMKKFLKSRKDYNETTTAIHKVPPEAALKPKVAQITEVKPVIVQPPLPPYPPPPDSPPNLNIIIKQEKEDYIPINGTETDLFETVNQEPVLPAPEKTEGERPRKTMCKEFARGDCKRSVCRFSHQLDLSQLGGVYTFCWNYQNARCTFPYCKFVHATIFEEAEFYRTGHLPPHARSHLKKPVPPPPLEENHTGVPVNFANPPPSHHTAMEKPMNLISCVPASSIEQRPLDDFTAVLSHTSSPLKRDWSEIEDFSRLPRDLEHSDHLAKKCKKCEIMEFRLHYNKEKLQTSIQATEDLKKKMTILSKKSSKLNTVLFAVMKQANNAKAGVTNIGGEKDKTLIEQLSSYIASNNRTSMVNDDKVVNNIFGNNFTSFMGKLLRGSGDQSLSADNSRET